MREIKFRAWDKANHNMLIIFDNITGENWFMPNISNKFEVMQYTGLKDKNSKDIYEGDIILISMEMIYGKPMEQNCKVWFEEQLSSFVCDWGNNPPVRIGSFCNTTFEVIGNIYENPELMEVSND